MVLRASSRSWQVVDLALERRELRVPAEGQLDRGDEVALLERLHEVGDRAGVAGLLDEVALGEGGEDQDRGEALTGDLACRGQAVEPWHLDVEDREVGRRLRTSSIASSPRPVSPTTS